MLLTVPGEINKHNRYMLTGNDYVSLPWIGTDGSIKEAGVVHYGNNCLVRFSSSSAEGLISPIVSIDGKVKEFQWHWHLLEHWIPMGRLMYGDVVVTITVLTPVDEKGFCCRLSAANRGPENHRVVLGFNVAAGEVQKHIFSSMPLPHSRHFFHQWTQTLVLDGGPGGPALAMGGELEWEACDRRGRYRFKQKEFLLSPGEQIGMTLYAAVNKEADGAATGVIHLRRVGWGRLLARTVKWLSMRKPLFPQNDSCGLFYRNLWFNYFYAAGKAVDNGNLVSVTSRSPYYYVSGAFWARDSLLWSFPALLLVSPARAKGVLKAAFVRHLRHAGKHAHYLDGTELYPGFELDQLAAYAVAVKKYLSRTRDFSLLRGADIKRGLESLAAKLLACKGKEGLYRTFLDPSDDPVSYPYLTYDNVLCWRALRNLAGFFQIMGNRVMCTRINKAAKELKNNIYRRCMTDGPCGRMFCWAVDGRGNYELYDAPPGSLQLITWYGFCTPESTAYRNTVKWIYSRHNPYYIPGKYKGLGSKHAYFPWVLSLANDLLSGAHHDVSAVLEGLTMDNGYACETYRPENGMAATGAAFAACAGFLANALWEHFSRGERKGESDAESNRRYITKIKER